MHRGSNFCCGGAGYAATNWTEAIGDPFEIYRFPNGDSTPLLLNIQGWTTGGYTAPDVTRSELFALPHGKPNFLDWTVETERPDVRVEVSQGAGFTWLDDKDFERVDSLHRRASVDFESSTWFSMSQDQSLILEHADRPSWPNITITGPETTWSFKHNNTYPGLYWWNEGGHFVNTIDWPMKAGHYEIDLTYPSNTTAATRAPMSIQGFPIPAGKISEYGPQRSDRWSPTKLTD